jgi:hypothetical protein
VILVVVAPCMASFGSLADEGRFGYPFV